MNGLQKSIKEHDKMMNEYIATHNIYKGGEPLHFDLRGYFKYIKENKLKHEDITQEIMDKFMLNSK